MKFDFTIEDSVSRADYIDSQTLPGSTFTAHQLESMANYILYGKDPDGTSCVDRKEVDITTKHGTWKKKTLESLDELMESPTFDERDLRNLKKDNFRKYKPTIDRIKDADVPGLPELWALIDEVESLITPANEYAMRHYLIELRRQQFLLRDSVKPRQLSFNPAGRTLHQEETNMRRWEEPDSEYQILPLGTFSPHKTRFTSPYHSTDNWLPPVAGAHSLDLTNPKHIYMLNDKYEELACAADDVDSVWHDILRTLDWAAQQTLSKEGLKWDIWVDKRHHLSGAYLAKKYKADYGVGHSANYISTIYTQKICVAIAATMKLWWDMWDLRDVDEKWQKCAKCGEMKLLDEREWVRKSKSVTGFRKTCKKCEKAKTMNDEQ